MHTDVDIGNFSCVGIESEQQQSFGCIEGQLIIFICACGLGGVVILGDVDGGDRGIALCVGECDEKEDGEESVMWVGYASGHVI